MSKTLIPKKNHKIFVRELSNLIKDYGKLKNLRDKKEIYELLAVRLPLIMNNFDKSDPLYDALCILIYDVFKNLGIIIKLVKEN